MKRERLFFIGGILIIVTGCLVYMNSKFDSLSRYPYKGEEMRETIRRHLNSKEIEYIIEYSIQPDLFMDYIDVEGFNIYHANEYRWLSYYLWTSNDGFLEPQEIVRRIELTRDYISKEELGKLLLNYSFDLVYEFIKEGDKYSPNSKLVENPMDFAALLDENQTLLNFEPRNLVLLNSSVPQELAEDIQVREVVNASLVQLCRQIETDLDKGKCAGLMIQTGYISYEKQVEIYSEALAKFEKDVVKEVSYPGHSDHQLGLSVDWTLAGVKEEDFIASEPYAWLLANAHRFGFIQTYRDDNRSVTNRVPELAHWRFIGKEAALNNYDEAHPVIEETPEETKESSTR